jgi:hypothetical protein
MRLGEAPRISTLDAEHGQQIFCPSELTSCALCVLLVRFFPSLLLSAMTSRLILPTAKQLIKSFATSAAPASGPAKFTLPALPYSYSALEPAISGQIMEVHHTKHHQTYVTNLNKSEPKTAQQQCSRCLYLAEG